MSGTGLIVWRGRGEDAQVDGGVDGRPSELVLHDCRERDLDEVPPERRAKSDDGEEDYRGQGKRGRV